MPIYIKENTVVVGTRAIALMDFPRWHAHHLSHYPRTSEIEQRGALLMKANFPFPQLKQFIQDVCDWGGYAGIAGRVLNQNREEKITECFRNAVEAFASSEPAAKALGHVNRLKNLGTPSFASKHLRFLRPDICAILDSKQQKSLKYPFDALGYQELSSDCCNIAARLNAKGIFLPSVERWGAAQVEMSIFAFLHLPDRQS